MQMSNDVRMLFVAMSQPIEASLALEILYQCADGLTHLHRSRLVHRDVRADNYLLASRDPLRVLITDFGLSHKLKDASDSTASHSATLIGPVGMLLPWHFLG